MIGPLSALLLGLVTKPLKRILARALTAKRLLLIGDIPPCWLLLMVVPSGMLCISSLDCAARVNAA